MHLKKKLNGLRKVNATLLMFLLTTVPAFAEKKSLIEMFDEATGGYYNFIVAVLLSISILITGVSLIRNKKDPQKREEEVDGLFYFGLGMGIIILAPHIMSFFGY